MHVYVYITCGMYVRTSYDFGGDIWAGTSGLKRIAGVYDPPETCDIPIEAEFHGDYDGGTG